MATVAKDVSFAYSVIRLHRFAAVLIAWLSIFAPIHAVGDSSSTCGEDTISVSVPRLYGTICGGSYRDMQVLSGAGETRTLPDIVINEKFIGALRTDGYVAIAANSWMIDSFDLTRAKLKAYRISDGADFTAFIVGGDGLATYRRNKTVGMTFKLNNVSDAFTGPVKIVLSGVQVAFSRYAAVGLDAYLQIGGAGVPTPDMDLPENDPQGLGCKNGSLATLSRLKVGWVGFLEYLPYERCQSRGNPTAWNATCEMSMETFWNAPTKFGYPGSFFVIATVPSSSGVGGLYAKTPSGSWQRFTSCADMPAYSSGLLGDCSFEVFNQPADITTLAGTQIYAGWGFVPVDSPTGAACEDLVLNGNYLQIFSVPSR